MNPFRQFFASTRSLCQRAVVAGLVIVSLLFTAQAQPVNIPAEMKGGGSCAEMACSSGCCENPVCCTIVQQKEAPHTPTAPPQHLDVQLATLGLRTYFFLLPPPVLRRSFVILDETGTAHTLSPLAANCIRLI